ncbi:MAG TPA: hypothetical protein VGO00_16660 [Kofleriaceae bacterium]|nr:hypothetical protein [Kofleriaceae bacterium]
MAPNKPSGARPPPVVLRIKLRYDDAESMVQRFAANVGRQGIFLPTKSIQPIDSEIKFELRLANDAPVIVGLGRVRSVRAPDPASPRAAFGMAIELMRVTRESRDLILRMLDRRKQLGLPDVAMPTAEDVDSSRRADSEPAPRKEREAIPEAAPIEPISAPVSESLMTAPRRSSAPMPIAKESSIPPLAPEPVKRPRPRISELIAKSAGAVAATPSIGDDDADVDVASAMARARALATGDLDQELESLKESAAAPREISIEAASAELAKQLGGSAVRRELRAKLVPPPTVAEGTAQTLTVTAAAEIPVKGRTQPLPRIKPLAPLSSIAPLPAEPKFLRSDPAIEPVAEWEAAVPTVASTEPPGAMTEATPAREPVRRPETPNPTYLRASTADIAEAIAAIDDVAGPVTIEAPPAVAEEPSRPSSSSMDVAIDDAFNATMRPDTPIPDDRADPDEFEAATAGPSVELTPLPHEVVHQLSELDMEDIEHTNVGAAPDGYNPDELADQLERHLADAEAEAEAELRQAIDEASGGVQAPSEIDEFEIEEVSDFEIIAEADADDADLLLADGERDASQDAAEPIADEPPLRPSQDFASRLDLGDDEFSAEHPPLAHALPDNPVTPSSGYALSAYDDRLHESPHSYEEEPLDFDRPSERYRYQPRSFDPLPNFDELNADRPPAEDFDEPHASFGQPRYESEPAAAQEPSRDVELERTLSALDVDLDDLSLPHARPLTPSPSSGAMRSRTPSGPVAKIEAPRTKQPTPAHSIPEATPAAGSGRLHRRASTEDGILIDFEDEED